MTGTLTRSADRQTVALPRVLIAGGGIAAAETALAIHAFAPARATVQILAPGPEVVLAPSATAASFDVLGRDTAQSVPLSLITDQTGASVHPGTLAAVDMATRVAVTSGGAEIDFHTLVVAVGATRVPALSGAALTFRGPGDVEPFRRLLDAIEGGGRRGVRTHVAVVVPPGSGWPLPAYELALLAAEHFARAELRDLVEISVVTAEDTPLGAFGPQASEAVRSDLDREDVRLWTSAVVRSWSVGRLHLVAGASVDADRVVALPVLRGPAIPGLPQDAFGFVRTDLDGRVEGLARVYAVGDAGSFAIKQGGIGCQQADTAASLVAIDLGAEIDAVPFTPILRGILATDRGRRFLRADLGGGKDESAGVTATHDPLWWPPDKLAGRFLAPFLAGLAPGREMEDRPAKP